uniref:Uncharacterized protein n=1 Tax=Oryza rufipogon TaxID=4529 RepID=A0A0E0PTY6_ORYRU
MQKRLMATNLSLGSAHCPTLPVVPYCRRNERAVNHSSCSWRRRSRGRWCPGIAGGGAERRAQGYEPRRPVSALPVSCCPVGAARLGVESPLQCLDKYYDIYQLCILSHRLQWQERVGWRIEALPEAMTGWIHDDEVAAVVKLCTASASGRGVGAPHSRAVVINKGQAPVLPEASRFAVHATVFSDDLENQMEKVKALVATL